MNKINNKIITFLDPTMIDENAKQQLFNISEMPFVFKHLAVMPDCHLGKGATVGSVIATKGAIIPAAVGVDIGCGMIAVKTKFYDKDLPDNLDEIRNRVKCSGSTPFLDTRGLGSIPSTLTIEEIKNKNGKNL